MHPILFEWIIGRFFSMSGRATRKEYLLRIFKAVLFLIGIAVLIFIGGFIEAAFKGYGEPIGLIASYLLFIFFFISPVIGICATVRRLHDLDRPGEHFFLLFMPVYNVYLMMLLIFVRGTYGVNHYGMDPMLYETESTEPHRSQVV